MFGHPLAKDMEKFWSDHGGRHYDKAWRAFVDDFAHLLTAKLDEQRAEHSNAGRFGMSKAGGCTRAAVLKLQQAEAKPLSGSTRATFWNGHMVEVLGIATLRAIGVPVDPATEDGKQHECRIDPFMLSYTDGLIAPDPRLGALPTLLTVKSVGYKMSGKTRDGWKRYGFAQYPFDGLKKTNPGYWAQAQAEMHARGASQSLFLLVAKDLIKKMEEDPYLGEKGNGSLTFYTEVVQYDKAWCEAWLLPTWDLAWRSHQEGSLAPAWVVTGSGEYVQITPADDKANKKATGTYSPCDYCDFRDACEASLGINLEQKLTDSIAEVA